MNFDAAASGEDTPHFLGFAGNGIVQRLRAEARVERDLTERPSPEARAAAGVSHLLNGEMDRAIAALEAARLARPRDARILNDLAAAYLESGLTRERPLHLLEGLDLAHQAATTTPDHPEPLFNLALGLDALHVRGVARSHWRKYLTADSENSPWRDLARRRLAALEGPSDAERWQELRRSLGDAAAGGDRATVAEITAAYPEEVLEAAEAWLFFDWPAAVSADDRERAASALFAAETVAAILPPAVGGHFLEQALSEVAATRASASDLSVAFGDLGTGYARIESFEVKSAFEPLQRARAVLRGRSSVYSARVSLLIALCRYQDGDYGLAASMAQSAVTEAEEVGDPTTVLRGLQILGVIETVRARYGKAVELYTRAKELAEAAGWMSSVAAIEGLLGETHDFVGDRERSWFHRGRALDAVHSITKARVRVRVWDDVVRSTMSRKPGVAFYFVDELVNAAEEADLPVPVIFALEKRAGVLGELGEAAAALSDLDEAELWTEQLQDRNLADIIRGDLLAARAELLITEDAEAATRAVDAAIAMYERTKYELDLPALLVRRARLRGMAGDAEIAIDDARLALEKIETAAALVRDPHERIHFAAQVRRAYDDAIELSIAAGQVDLALRWVEASRWPLRPRESAQVSPVLPTWRLPANVAILVFRPLPTRLLVWVVRRDGVAFHEVPVPRASLEERIAEFRRALRWEAETTNAAAMLHDILLSRIRPNLARISDLVVVADGQLNDVSFAALYDAASRRYLLQDFGLTAGQSVSGAIEAAASPPAAFDAATPVLAVGNPRVSFPTGLPDLPHAESEARAVAKLFPRTTLLLGTSATEARVREELRVHRLAHLGSHTLAPGGDPLLVKLALSADDEEDGMYTAYEILEMELANLGLVVLSTCGSGASQSARLRDSFLEAGAEYVLASLWDVSDQPTSVFIRSFYEGIHAGADPAEALRQAQLTQLRKESRSSAWAAFQLTRQAPDRGEEK